MRERPLNSRRNEVGTRGHRRPANSLFRNILRVSYCSSIFCGEPQRSPVRNLFKLNILAKVTQHISSARPPTKSLFRNILPVSLLRSIFCADFLTPPLCKSFEVNILRELDRKKVYASMNEPGLPDAKGQASRNSKNSACILVRTLANNLS